MKIVVTGANGFIGKHVVTRLTEMGADFYAVTRSTSADGLVSALDTADFVFHLAGVNRPRSLDEFVEGNVNYTQALCAALEREGCKAPLVYASSVQATSENAYGRSKRAAEEAVLEHGQRSGSPVYVLRLPNVFGKWCKPHYNSAIATFCYQLARGLPIKINDPQSALRLVYIDDLVDMLVGLVTRDALPGFLEVAPVYDTTVGAVARILQEFESSRTTLVTERVGTGLLRALYSTYLSYLPPERFSYVVPRHSDPRGVFVEMLKTPDCGQVSYFTAGPGVTRGEHYHHTKTEKFLTVAGTARFQFRHLITGETYELTVRSDEGRIVESIPGWAHNVTNIGADQLIMMLWASEIFDRNRPDTTPMKVSP